MRRHLSFANVLSCLALFMAISGVAYAATLGKNSVKAKNIAKNAVTTPKLKNGAVTAAKLRNGAVTDAKIGDEAVSSTKLGAGAVRSAALGGGVVTTAKLKDGAVTEAKLANNAVGSSKLGANSVATGKVQDGAVSGAKLAPSLLAQLLRNVTYVTKASSSDSSSPKSVTADCPSGKEAIGGGARLVLGSAISVALGESAPKPPDAEGRRTGWVATANEVAPDPESWSVEAFAVCAEL